MKKIILMILIVLFVFGCAPKIEIREEGQAGTEILIAPSVDNVIKDTVTITMTKVPEGTKTVGFAIEDSGVQGMSGSPNLGFDEDGSDGWSKTLDTTEYSNGEHMIIAAAFDVEIRQGDRPETTGGVRADVVIDNTA